MGKSQYHAENRALKIWRTVGVDGCMQYTCIVTLHTVLDSQTCFSLLHRGELQKPTSLQVPKAPGTSALHCLRQEAVYTWDAILENML